MPAPLWIDLALIGSEPELTEAVGTLTLESRSELMSAIANVLGIDLDELQIGLLRILLERVRPFALSKAIWSRPLTSSSDVAAEVRAHLESLSIDPTVDRVTKALDLYVRFSASRRAVPVSASALERQGYRCGHCGLAFFNEELSDLALVSPFGNRGTAKMDPFKTQWLDLSKRLPRMDHDWPISLYGDNNNRNMRVLCDSCNGGKENYMLLEQMKPVTGLPNRKSLTSEGTLPLDVFYAQIRRSPRCYKSGATAAQSELTVELRKSDFPPVLDNLLTIATADTDVPVLSSRDLE
jgi:hypothetical protein